MRSLLRRRSEDEQRGVVLLGEELEGCGVFEWVDSVLLGEFFGERDSQLVEITEGILDDLRAAGAAEEEG